MEKTQCLQQSVMTIKWFKPPFKCVIFPLTQPQVANQQEKKKKKKKNLGFSGGQCPSQGLNTT